jgi:hypothetical protein
MFCKSIIIKPYMFRSLLYDNPQELSFVLSAFTTFPLLASSFGKRCTEPQIINDMHMFANRTYIYIYIKIRRNS